ncbi:hypothetical protein Fot_37564 [Forsythia ovata]|uniref:Uncharacterized protein n=1 Tax=Forsythia ovata TaxID=205694 RepID=A0ABD1S1R5_9LAMI
MTSLDITRCSLSHKAYQRENTQTHLCTVLGAKALSLVTMHITIDQQTVGFSTKFKVAIVALREDRVQAHHGTRRQQLRQTKGINSVTPGHELRHIMAHKDTNSGKRRQQYMQTKVATQENEVTNSGISSHMKTSTWAHEDTTQAHEGSNSSKQMYQLRHIMAH